MDSVAMTPHQLLLNLIEEYKVLDKKDPGRVETVVTLMHLQEILSGHTEEEINSRPDIEGFIKEKDVQARDILATIEWPK
jgi:hypothetical protein